MDAAAKAFVRQRAGGRCEYCYLPEEADELPFHVEHIIARQHGGTDDNANLCWACSRCNLYKGPNIASIDDAVDTIVALFNPRSDEWTTHFEMRDVCIIGRTAVGRATVKLLQMNDSRRVDLRQDLKKRGILSAP
jgi:5-methylcytosine-specific restriction endonuclease McrA